MVPLLPCFTVIGVALIEKSQAVPVNVTACGLPLALSAIDSVAERLPVAPVAGVNVTLMTHVAFAARVAPFVQVDPVAIANSAIFVPLITGAAVRLSVAFPVFFNVTV
jgi:hypothetical protein